jgi:hypothetical protein
MLIINVKLLKLKKWDFSPIKQFLNNFWGEHFDIKASWHILNQEKNLHFLVPYITSFKETHFISQKAIFFFFTRKQKTARYKKTFSKIVLHMILFYHPKMKQDMFFIKKIRCTLKYTMYSIICTNVPTYMRPGGPW